jgi:hypothetical protein
MKDIGDEMLAFAQLTSRRALIKGLDTNAAGCALMLAGIELWHGVGWERANELMRHANAYILAMLCEQTIQQYAAEGMSETDLATLRNVAEQGAADLPVRPIPQLVETARDIVERM